ncbi:unnamed protein product [Fraxinus pennsylvanica]|uniref:TFIIS N-terminal domain-containing protein n=1 Tax=Fraxinus pennsylvanica TaxID=56036 RepID=A0AAD1YVY0_9LAMI|nr:unnamed protein product [Fraxinus pennsylvanica]
MDSDEIRAILSRSRVGIWALIDTAIKVAISDYAEDLKHRRDKIVESLYSSPSCNQLCQNCNSSINVESNNRNSTGEEEQEEEDLDPYGGLFDDEQTKILRFKEQLEEPNQTEEYVVELLQNLADMDITFQALKETDIGRYVNGLRKYPSNEVRRLVKQLVRKWKETVDEWVKVNQPEASSNLIADGDSPQQNMSKNQHNGHHQVPDFGYSPNPQSEYGKSGPERNSLEYEPKSKPSQSVSRRETPSRPPQPVPKSASAPPNKQQREAAIDDERLNSARRRLQENYQEAQNAKKQRTIQVMDIHEIPKPKNGFIGRNKGSGFQGRNHRHEIVGLVTKTGSDVQKFKAGGRVGVGAMVGSYMKSLETYLCRHEIVGLVTKTGSDVQKFKAGGRVGVGAMGSRRHKNIGGYSDIIVVDQPFVLRIPDNLSSEACAPLLCAGITVYSPMKYYGMTEPGKHLGVAGLGGPGHVAVNTSPKKESEAINKLGADSFLVSTDLAQLKAAMGTMDFIIGTISAVHPLAILLGLLKMNGKLVTVGLPDKPLELPIFPLVNRRKLVGGSDIGGMKETRDARLLREAQYKCRY